MPTDEKIDNYVVLLETRGVDNSKIITWIKNSATPSIGLQLAKYETAKAVWDHLAKLYTQSNFAKQCQLETDIRTLQQNDSSIHDFYSSMATLWDQLALTEHATLSSFNPYIKRRESQRLVQFLMALRHDFEGLCGLIFHREPLPSVDSASQ
uniref:Gag-Pol polyprotein n=1 Tax=Tanacetum cinerariifolium TaxID=118510 RepID=A0A699HEW9_TANCI|nr:Gag-Pol polyprotein [Tanacetum cinerariifolium]